MGRSVLSGGAPESRVVLASKADLAFLQTAASGPDVWARLGHIYGTDSKEAELTAVSDRMLVLACTLIWLLSDYLVQRLCPFPPAPEADKLYLRDELHEASLFLCVAFSLAVAGTRGAATPLLWLSSLVTVGWLCEQHLEHSTCITQVGQPLIACVRGVLVTLLLWALYLACRCCGCCGSGISAGSTKKKSTDGELGSHKDWTVRIIDGLEVDIEEPDLYIPTMGFVTYVVLYGVVRGIQETFAPEVLSATISSALVILVVEMALMKGALFMAGAVNTPTLDLLALLGYKFLYLSLHLGVGLLCGHGRRPAGFFYGLLVCGLHISCGFALWQALRRLARLQPSHGQECVTDMHHMCIKVLPIMQAAVCWLLLPSWPKVVIVNAPEEVTIAITTTAASVLSGNSSAV
eukprot:s1629_g17.t1